MIDPYGNIINKITIALLCCLCVNMTGCSSKEQSAVEYYESGYQYFQKGEIEKSRVEFLNAIQANPQHGKAYYHLGLIAQKDGDIPLVYEHMRLAIHLDEKNIDAKIIIAELLVFGQKFDEALIIAEAILSLDSSNYDGLRLKIAALVGLKDFDNALTLLDKAMVFKPNDTSLLGLNAVIAKEQDDNEKALNFLDKAIEAGGKDKVQYILLRMSINRDKKDYAALENDLVDLIQERPDESEYVFSLAKIYVAKKQLKEAEKILNRFVFDHPNDTKAKKILIDVISLSDQQRAESTLVAMLEEQYHDADLRFYKINRLLQQRNVESAKTELEMMFSNDFKEEETLTAQAMMAELLFKQGDIQGALASINKNLKVEPGHEESHLLLAYYELSKKNFDLAGASLRIVLKRNPESEKALVLLGRMYMQSGSGLLADDSYRQALALNPANLGAAVPVANKLLASQDLERADKVITAALEKKPLDKYLVRFLIEIKLLKNAWEDAHKLNLRLRHLDETAEAEHFQGRISQGRREYKQALEHYKKAIELDPQREETLQGIAVSYLASSDEQRLLSYLESFKRQYPDFLHAYTVPALVHKKSNRLNESIKNIEQALERQPNWLYGYFKLANYKLDLEDRAGAIAVYEKVIATYPEQENLKLLLATYYESIDDTLAAEKYYKNILSEHPNNNLAINNYAALLLDKLPTDENIKMALALAEKLKNEDSAVFLDTYAWALIKNEQYIEGEKYARMALALAPAMVEIQYHLGVALKFINRKHEAKSMFKRALLHVDDDLILKEVLEYELKTL